MPAITFDETGSVLEPVAIVGMACRLPGSVDSPLKFWEMLRDGRSVHTPKVPASRFNIDAHYHPDGSRPGSLPAMGGYFLAEDPVDFDPTFFNISPVEARWMDPQQRKILEVCYEVLESAGIPLSTAAGSNTGVYVATFTSDYQQMSLFERDFRHNYAATGVDPGIIANRVNNVFNLAGPSCVINTACSSSVYAIHNACHALRAGDCDAAITAGSNIIMTVDQHMNTANLGILSPTSECHTFDNRADGYGRAEGVGALYLKRLSDAIRDNDVIRGVIRSSAVNANGKVSGMGITFPNASGQEKALRHAYERANLDPNRTAYLECHGTGTPTGDPIEVKAVSMGMNDSRSRKRPLLLGSVKASIGHSEAASGIFATMKAALMTEHAQIPAVHGIQTVNPSIKEKEWNVKVVKNLMPWPTGFDVRRASLSSFGYGGTNAHLIVESISGMFPWYQHGQPKDASACDSPDDVVHRPLLITMSAHDEATLRRNVAAHLAVASQYHLVDLAYTLNQRRSRFASRGYTLATPGREAEAFGTDRFTYSTTTASTAAVGFLFTGQGAQWPCMGREAMRTFPGFAETIRALDRVLQLHAEPRPSWRLESVLDGSDDDVDSGAVHAPEVAQPACTAVQIAMVDLLAAWGITTEVSVGHSSGEIAAAYASGRVSAPEAILAAYFRGYAVAHAAPIGAMLAVGLGIDDVAEHLRSLPNGRLTIACENSPRSVTISGSCKDIQSLQKVLEKTTVFHRRLKTDRAYHSHQMSEVAPIYTELYSKAERRLDSAALTWRRPLSPMVSSVTGSSITSAHLSIAYWCENLLSQVRFNAALAEVGALPELSHVNVLVEIGPHPALGGPVKQIIQSNEYEMRHIASLKRDTDSACAILQIVGDLYVSGYPVDCNLVNSNSSQPLEASPCQRKPHYLPDLPPYQWNYDRRYWYQPRAMQELRESKIPRHDILGRRIFGLSTNASTWKNILRLRDVPWLGDHVLGTEVLFPAAGYLSLAIEALLQQLDLEPQDISAVRFRNVKIDKALIIPDDDEGIEVHTRLERLQASDGWYACIVESVVDGLWTRHSTAKVRHETQDASTSNYQCQGKPSLLHQHVPGKQWYRSFRRVGFKYGPSFQTVSSINADGKNPVASACVRVQTSCPNMEAESRYLMHPSTIDGCLHVVIASVHRGLHKQMPWGVIPVEIQEVVIGVPRHQDVGLDGTCTAWTDQEHGRSFIGRMQLLGVSGRRLLQITNWNFVAYEAAVPPQHIHQAPRQPYRKVVWEPFSEPPIEHVSETPPIHDRMRVVVLHGGNVSLALALGAPPIFLSAAELTFAHMFGGGGGLQNGTTHHEWITKPEGVVIDETSAPVLSALTGDSWAALKTILQSDLPVVWVTRGANSGVSPSSGLAPGFLRAIRSELSASSRFALVDVDPCLLPELVADRVRQRLVALRLLRSGTGDLEFWLTAEAKMLVPRLEANEELNGRFFGTREPRRATLSAGTAYRAVPTDDEVVFEALPDSQVSCPRPNEVEVRVLFAQVTKDALSPRAADPATIITGLVERVGSALDASLQGRPVVAFTLTKLPTLITTEVFSVLGDESLLENAARVLPHLVRAVDATLHSPKARQGDHVFVLPGSSSLFQEAIDSLGAKEGLRISRLPSDVSLAQSLVQANTGRCIVVGNAKTPLIPEIWLAMPRQSDFVLIDVSVEDYSLDMCPFPRGVKLHVSSITDRFRNDPSTLTRILQESVNFIDHLDHCSAPLINFGQLSDLSAVRRLLKESPCSVMSLDYGHGEVKLQDAHEPIRLNSDFAYLLVGCLGGLGRSLATWMFERGCRHFAFISRSGTSKAKAAELVQSLNEWGANVHVFAVDASDKKAVAQVVSTVSAHRKIGGVIHAAMVLQDCLFHNMTLSAYHAALRPKMQAALALDDALGETPLDFFIMTSSISGVLGNPGQANYAAANSFLDFLALSRRRRGLAGTSLALPMVEDVGVAAENSAIAKALARKMPFSVDEQEMLDAFEAAIYQGVPSGEDVQSGDVQVVVGLEPSAMLEAMGGMSAAEAFWYGDERMKSVLQELDALVGASDQRAEPRESGGFIATLAGVPTDEASHLIGKHVMERAARILGMNSESFKYKTASVASHGIDSMIGVELQAWLFKEFGYRATVQVLSNPKTTFEGLSNSIADSLGI